MSVEAHHQDEHMQVVYGCSEASISATKLGK